MSNAAVIEAVRHTVIAGGGANQVVATAPVGKVGKTLCALLSHRGIGAWTPVEAGWTEHFDFTDVLGPQLAFYTRPSTDAEPATYTFNHAAVGRLIASLFNISNSLTGIEAFSAEVSGNSLTPTFASVVSPGANRVCCRILNRTHTNAQVVPSYLNQHLRWNTGGTDAGAVGHLMTADIVGAGATVAEVTTLDTTPREWRGFSFVVGPGDKILSKVDRMMLELSSFPGSSVADKERNRLKHILGYADDNAAPGKTLDDLYQDAFILGQGDGRNRLM